MNIILTGFMGTGKTAVGKCLAKQLGWRFVDLDRVIETGANKSIPQIFAEHGEQVFRRLEKRAIRRLAHAHEQVISTGGGSFVDPESRRLLRAVGPVICLTAAPKVILQRVGPTLSRRPMLATEPGYPPKAGGRGSPVGEAGGAHAPSPLARIQQLMQQRASAYAQADLTIDTGSLSIEQVAEQIWEQVGPWVSKSWQYLLKHSHKLSQRYGGKYIVVLDDRIVSVGTTQLEAFQRLAKPVPRQREVGIYYVPLPEESAVAL